MLGMAGVCIQEQPRRADHILSLVNAGKINLKSPLRYYGRLADEPEKLPWGTGYDIELSGVDYEGCLYLQAAECGLVISHGRIIQDRWRCMWGTPSRF
jgi:hypothetical protein